MIQPFDGRYPDRGSNTGACPPGLKPKDLCGVPWRLAFALQDDGWYLRMDNIWDKPNPMRESVQDRPTRSHEYVFLLSKGPRYYYDYMAVRTRDKGTDHARSIVGGQLSLEPSGGILSPHSGIRTHAGRNGDGANLTSVWDIPCEPYRGAHFATYPRRLVSLIIKAGTSEKGVCVQCGAPWRRVVSSSRIRTRPGRESKCYDRLDGSALPDNDKPWSTNERSGNRDPGRHVAVKHTIGWEPTCKCGRTDVKPAIVFDPFVGSGTTIVVAEALGRRAIGMDLSRDYLINQARRRIERPHAKPVKPVRDEVMPLFDGM
jgi:hypothetical protein